MATSCLDSSLLLLSGKMSEILYTLIPAVAAVAIFIIGYYKSQRDEARKDAREVAEQAEKAKEVANAQANPFPDAARANSRVRRYRNK